MRLIILVFLILCSFEVIGQNHLIGIRDGVNFSNITNNEYTKSKMNIYSGVTYEYRKENDYFLDAELIFNRRGAFYKQHITDFWGDNLGQHYTKLNFDYISLPLKAGYNFGDKFFGLINVGVIPSYLITAKVKTPRIRQKNNIDHEPEIGVITNYFSRFDIAGFGEIGGGYKLENDLSLFFSFTYQQSLNTIGKEIGFLSDERHKGRIVSLGA